MIKKDLLAMPLLRATPKMMHLAAADKQENRTGYRYGESSFERKLYLRCGVQDHILQISMYLPQYMRAGTSQPCYRLFIDTAARKFLTYDTANKKWLTAKVDRLEHTPYSSSGVWIGVKDNALIKKCLESSENGYVAVRQYQYAIREEELERRHRRETDPWDLDLAQTRPLPKDWKQWVTKVGILEQYIFYDYKKGGATQGYCSYCERDITLKEKSYHNRKGVCPRCRHQITYKALGRFGHFHTEDHCVHLIQKCSDGIMLREFWASRHYRREEYKKPTVHCYEDQRTILDRNMNVRRYYWGSYKNKSLRWIGGTPPQYYGYYWYSYRNGGDGRIYGKTLPFLKGTILQQTGLVDWIYRHGMVTDPKRYMLLWKSLPQYEQIWKANLTQLEKECREKHESVRSHIKAPQETALIPALGLDALRFKRLQRHNGGIKYLDWLHWEMSSGKFVPDEMIHWFQAGNIDAADLSFIQDRMNPVQVYNYIRRQAEETNMPPHQVLTTWKDYLSMAEKLGIDTQDEIIYRARLLRQRHDELVVRMKEKDCERAAAEVLKSFPQVDEICQSLKEKFEYANGDYAVVAPSGAKDIISEGRILSHCVGGSDRYWDRIQQHESYILFLRRADTPHIPYYTLEVEPDGTIRQKRTRFDRQEADIEQAKKFLVKWQKAIAKRLDANDKSLSQKSKILREQEFAQMRKDHVVIHTGELAGQSLADVLMADLMESVAA